MNLIDTHAHLDRDNFENPGKQVKKAQQAEVVSIIVPGTDLSTSRDGAKLADRFPGVYFAAGVHCHEASKFTREDLNEVSSLLSHPKAVAVGEVGLDYHYDFTPKETQKEVLASQLDLSIKADKPLILHCREAEEDLYEMLSAYDGRLRGVIHCFTGNASWAVKFADLGFFVGFTGIITFKNAHKVRDALKAVPLERLLTETDSPYMTPVPHRGKRNSPAMLPLVNAAAAGILKLTPREIAPILYSNACRCFGIEVSEEILNKNDN